MSTASKDEDEGRPGVTMRMRMVGGRWGGWRVEEVAGRVVVGRGDGDEPRPARTAHADWAGTEATRERRRLKTELATTSSPVLPL